jgi:hypothetical protein
LKEPGLSARDDSIRAAQRKPAAVLADQGWRAARNRRFDHANRTDCGCKSSKLAGSMGSAAFCRIIDDFLTVALLTFFGCPANLLCMFRKTESRFNRYTVEAFS